MSATVMAAHAEYLPTRHVTSASERWRMLWTTGRSAQLGRTQWTATSWFVDNFR